MAFSKEMRKLQAKWEVNRGWPKRLEWLEIDGIRGWTGQRIDFTFPFVAIVGENGVGKSTILQAIASIYRAKTLKESYFASDFFPDTAWETLTNASIKYSVREGDLSTAGSVRKPTDRWRGNPERRERPVRYIDLRRTQPMATQVGYSRIAKSQFKEAKRELFDNERLSRFSGIVGRSYDLAALSLTDADSKRWVPIVQLNTSTYSGYHQGAGEMALIELLKVDIPEWGIVLIDEIETSLHPRAQRRLVRDLAELCRQRELQVIITTHSPYVLEELPVQGRAYVMNTTAGRQVITGVSPYFAMTQMDEERHPEIDLYVEDDRSRILLEELIVVHKRELLPRCSLIPFGAASVGQSLGIMVAERRFPRPSLVFLDSDQEAARGCLLLPGDDAPERVVFEALKIKAWLDVPNRIGRSHSEFVDGAEAAMVVGDHHEWIRVLADRLIIGSNTLWRAMCSAWAAECLDKKSGTSIVEEIQTTLDGITTHNEEAVPEAVEPIAQPKPAETIEPPSTTQAALESSSSGQRFMF